MSLWEAFILGLVQGITEFLPVSSSGHLVLVQHWLGLKEDLFTFDAVIHGGSLLAVMLVFRQELRQMAVAFGGGTEEEKRLGRKLWLLVGVGTIPLVLVGLTMRHLVEQAFTSVYITAFMLYVTGVLLLIAEKLTREVDGTTPEVAEKVSLGKALAVGLFQCLAVLPGLSRSGTTIAAGMMAGLDRQMATRFSFLLSVPAIAGATLLELRKVFKGGPTEDVSAMALLVGTAAAAVSSYYSIILLLKFLRHGRFMGFVYYCWFLATVVLIFTYKSAL